MSITTTTTLSFGVEFVLDSNGASLYHICETMVRVPHADEFVYLSDTGYKVESVEVHLEDVEDVNPVSGQVAPWHLTKELYIVRLSVLP